MYEKTHDLTTGINCYEVNSDGSLGKKIFKTNTSSDWMAVDIQGNIYTTWGSFGKKVYIMDADGEKVDEIAIPEGPANVCFGSEDYKTLFITAETSLYSVRVKYPGTKPKWCPVG